MLDTLKQAFLVQAQACDDLGSPFMAALMRGMVDIFPAQTALARLFAGWPGDIGPSGASLPLRLAGGLHHLVLTGQDPALAATYPPHRGAPVLQVVARALQAHDAFLADWVRNAPQTNEVGRSAVVLAGAATVANWAGLPLRVSELGASAGLNLNFHRYRVEGEGLSIGARDAALTLRPQWRGACRPPSDAVTVEQARGVDLNPLSAARDGLRLLSYIWPDQAERLARMQAALAMAVTHPPQVDRGDAAGWLETRLTAPHPGQCHLVYHTIAFQYFPPDTQNRIEQAMVAAGRAATAAAPLAWLAMEADEAKGSAGVTLRLWPGDLRIALARAGFHGQWIDWLGV